MKLLITGAAGFLGRVLVRQLAGRHELVCLTRALSDDLPMADGIEWLPMDLSRGLDTTRLPEAMDAVIHLAQSNGYRDFPAQAQDVFDVNIALTQALCSYATRAGASRMVLASTGTVYEPFTGPMRETDAVRPTGYYGASKLAAELISESYSNQFAVANLRVFFLYGKGQQNMLIARLIDSVTAGREVTLPRDGEGLVFVPTHVEDCARVFVEAVESAWQGPLNVASPHQTSLGNLLRAIERESGVPLNLKLTDDEPPSPIVPDLAKLATLTDMSRFLTIEQGIARTLQG